MTRKTKKPSCYVKNCRRSAFGDSKFCSRHRYFSFFGIRHIHSFYRRDPTVFKALVFVATVLLTLLIWWLSPSAEDNAVEVVNVIKSNPEIIERMVDSRFDALSESLLARIPAAIASTEDIVRSAELKYPEASQRIETLAREAETAVEELRYPVADSIYQLLIQFYPGIPDFYKNLASSLIEQSKLADAVIFQATYVSMEPNNAYGHLTLGALNNQLGNHSEAISEAEAAVELSRSPLDVRLARANLGFALADSGLYERAKNEIIQGILPETSPSNIVGNSFIYDRLAFVYFAQDSLLEAQHFFELALQKNPESPFLNHNLGLCFAKRGELDSAIAKFNYALGIDPNLPLTRHMLAQAYWQKGSTSEAWIHLRVLMHRNPEYFMDLFGVRVDDAGNPQ